MAYAENVKVMATGGLFRPPAIERIHSTTGHGMNLHVIHESIQLYLTQRLCNSLTCQKASPTTTQPATPLSHPSTYPPSSHLR